MPNYDSEMDITLDLNEGGQYKGQFHVIYNKEGEEIVV